MPSERVLYVDVDGTLVSPGGDLFWEGSTALVDALLAARAGGLAVVPVTGRGRVQVRELCRLLGLAREIVIAALFGNTGATSAYRTAARLATVAYDLLISGAISAALVPVFSDYARAFGVSQSNGRVTGASYDAIVGPHRAVAFVGSGGTVEVAVRDGSAARMLGVGVGAQVRV